MELKVSQPKVMRQDDGYWLSVQIADVQAARRFCLTAVGDYTLTLKQYRKKRSLDANAYCWVMIDKIAKETGLSKAEVYRQAIMDIGGNSEVLPIREDAVESWKRIWESRGVGWICESLGPSKLPGYVNMVNYYGSSVYDTKQMSQLIDSIIQECKTLDIETLSERDLALLKEG